MSLALRLTLYFTISTTVLVVISAALFYWALLSSLRHENNAYMINQVRDARGDLHDPLVTSDEINDEIQANRPSEGDAFATYTRVMSGKGQIIGQTPLLDQFLPPDRFPEPTVGDRLSGSTLLATMPDRSTRRFFVMAAVAPSGLPFAQPYVLQIAMDLSEEDKLLGQYRMRIWMIVLPALAGCVLAGYGIARSGIAPIRQIVSTIRGVQSTTLDQRIEPAGYPADLQVLALTFNAMLSRIQDAFNRLSRFSADIAHELRTPLGSIRGEMEVTLAKARSPEEYRETLGSCLEECVRLSQLIDRLLFIARAERHETPLRREPVPLRAELEKVAEFYDAAASEAGVRLVVHVPDALEAFVDRTLLQSALGNLIDNAIRHTPSGGVITLSARQTAGAVELEVADTGSGIPAEHLPFVLDRFYRVDSSRTRDLGGTGLGLAIVKGIATLHRGQVSIQSEVGTGTRVSLIFPTTT